MNYTDAKEKDRLMDNPTLEEENNYFFECGKAKGYLDCHAQAKKLAAALEDAIEHCSCTMKQRLDGHSIDCLCPEWMETLDSWKTGVTKQKGGENENS